MVTAGDVVRYRQAVEGGFHRRSKLRVVVEQVAVDNDEIEALARFFHPHPLVQFPEIRLRIHVRLAKMPVGGRGKAQQEGGRRCFVLRFC